MKATHPIREGRPHHVATEGHMATRGPSHKATEDAERDDVGLLDDDVHVLVDDGAVLEVEEDGGVAVNGGSLGLWKTTTGDVTT